MAISFAARKTGPIHQVIVGLVAGGLAGHETKTQVDLKIQILCKLQYMIAIFIAFYEDIVILLCSRYSWVKLVLRCVMKACKISKP